MKKLNTFLVIGIVVLIVIGVGFHYVHADRGANIDLEEKTVQVESKDEWGNRKSNDLNQLYKYRNEGVCPFYDEPPYQKDDRGTIIHIISDLFDMSVEEIHGERLNGKSFGEIGEEKGISKEQLKVKILEEKEKRVQQLVENNVITEQQKERILQRFAENIDIIINREDVGPINGQRKRGYGNKGKGCCLLLMEDKND